MGILVLGAEGTQIDNFTITKYDYVPPKVPWGGGSGLENITLEYLFEEYQFKNNNMDNKQHMEKPMQIFILHTNLFQTPRNRLCSSL